MKKLGQRIQNREDVTEGKFVCENTLKSLIEMLTS